jgi:hypothetical protein
VAFALTHFLDRAVGLHSMGLMERTRALLAFGASRGVWQLLALAILVRMVAALVAESAAFAACGAANDWPVEP